MIHDLSTYGGTANILGQLRAFLFHNGSLTIEGISVQESRNILSVLSTGKLDGGALTFGGVLAEIVNTGAPGTISRSGEAPERVTVQKPATRGNSVANAPIITPPERPAETEPAAVPVAPPPAAVSAATVDEDAPEVVRTRPARARAQAAAEAVGQKAKKAESAPAPEPEPEPKSEPKSGPKPAMAETAMQAALDRARAGAQALRAPKAEEAPPAASAHARVNGDELDEGDDDDELDEDGEFEDEGDDQGEEVPLPIPEPAPKPKPAPAEPPAEPVRSIASARKPAEQPKPANTNGHAPAPAAAAPAAAPARAAAAAAPREKGEWLIDPSNIPPEVYNAKSMRSLVLFFAKNNVKDAERIYAECNRIKAQVPMFERVSELKTRIEAALEMLV